MLGSFATSRCRTQPVLHCHLPGVARRHCRTPSKLVVSLRRCCNFSYFQDGGRRHLGFSKSWILFADGILRAQTHHYIKFCQNRSFLCGDIAIFRIFKMAAAAILNFWNREILLVIRVQRVEAHQYAKFRNNRAIGCEDTKGLYHSAKFGYDRCSSFYKPPAHRCPRQQRQRRQRQRQRVTERTAMAPWNGPNNSHQLMSAYCSHHDSDNYKSW